MVFTLVFLLLAIVGIALFIFGKSVSSLLILFFFITDGYQLLPLEALKIGGLVDYALVQVVGTFLYFAFVKKSIVFQMQDRVTKAILILFFVLLIIVFVNVVFLGISPVDCVVSLRNFAFLLAFFLFPFVTLSEYKRINTFLLYITAVLSLIYIVQVFINVPLLNGYYGGGAMDLGFITIPRCYNYPVLLPYFFFQVYFSDMSDRKIRLALQVLFSFAILLPQHRSMIASLVILMLLGFIVRRGSLVKSLKYVVICVLLFIGLKSVMGDRFSTTATDDIEQVLSGNYADFDFEKDNESTLFYRFAMLSERVFYITDRGLTTIFGGGLMREGTPKSIGLNFYITYFDDAVNMEYMVSTPDISWSMMIFRLGMLGTFVFVYFFSILSVSLFRFRFVSFASVGSFLFLLFLFFTSFTGAYLYYIWPFLLPLLDCQMLKKMERNEKIIQAWLQTNDTDKSSDTVKSNAEYAVCT